MAATLMQQRQHGQFQTVDSVPGPTERTVIPLVGHVITDENIGALQVTVTRILLLIVFMMYTLNCSRPRARPNV